MADVIEKVARAMAEALYEAGSVVTAVVPNAGWGLLNEQEHDVLRLQAKAALAALEAEGLVIVPREPTEAMLRAFVAIQIDGKKGGDPDQQVPVPGTGQGDMQFYELWRT